MSSDDLLQGACSCGRYKYAVHVPNDVNARRAALVHFGSGDHDRMAERFLTLILSVTDDNDRKITRFNIVSLVESSTDMV